MVLRLVSAYLAGVMSGLTVVRMIVERPGVLHVHWFTVRVSSTGKRRGMCRCGVMKPLDQ